MYAYMYGVCLSVCLSVCPSICMFVYLSVMGVELKYCMYTHFTPMQPVLSRTIQLYTAPSLATATEPMKELNQEVK